MDDRLPGDYLLNKKMQDTMDLGWPHYSNACRVTVLFRRDSLATMLLADRAVNAIFNVCFYCIKSPF
jgi:1,2-phenylacetyl-CoA epoxidase catalytic subunit